MLLKNIIPYASSVFAMFNLLESDSSVSVPRARRRLSYRKQTQKLTENSYLNSNREDKGKQ